MNPDDLYIAYGDRTTEVKWVTVFEKITTFSHVNGSHPFAYEKVQGTPRKEVINESEVKKLQKEYDISQTFPHLTEVEYKWIESNQGAIRHPEGFYTVVEEKRPVEGTWDEHLKMKIQIMCKKEKRTFITKEYLDEMKNSLFKNITKLP